MTPKALVNLVLEAIDIARRPSASEPETSLPAEELAVLEAGLSDLPELNEQTRDYDPVLATAIESAVVIATSFDVNRTAKLLGISPRRVRDRIKARTLYGFRWHGRWRLPPWQFAGSKELPGLALLLPHLTPDLCPEEISDFMQTPDVELTPAGSCTPLCPYDWLRRGLPLENVAHLAQGFSEIP